MINMETLGVNFKRKIIHWRTKSSKLKISRCIFVMDITYSVGTQGAFYFLSEYYLSNHYPFVSQDLVCG
jgi:hypothetical protein